jgi:cell shape-determining protein MreC
MSSTEKEIQSVVNVIALFAAMNLKIERLEAENAQLREELAGMTQCATNHSEGRSELLSRLTHMQIQRDDLLKALMDLSNKCLRMGDE